MLAAPLRAGLGRTEAEFRRLSLEERLRPTRRPNNRPRIWRSAETGSRRTRIAHVVKPICQTPGVSPSAYRQRASWPDLSAAKAWSLLLLTGASYLISFARRAEPRPRVNRRTGS
jgi:hypothetical protein